VLPLVPGYVSLISGVGVEELKSQESQLLRKVMLNSIGFILGFSIVFIALGAISTEVGQLMARYKSVLARVAGVVIILFGLHLDRVSRSKRCTRTRDCTALKGAAPGRGVPDWLCLRFRVDAVRGTDPRRDSRHCCGQDSVFKGILLLAAVWLAQPDWLCHF
jgi:cytochrome c-type biogenesis protein